MIGDVKFIWTEYRCPKCQKQFTIDEIKQTEPPKYKKLRTFLGIMIVSLLLLAFIQINVYVGQWETNTSTRKQIPVHYMYNMNPIYVHWQKHFCPECETKMETAYDSVIVNSNSPEAKNYDFSLAGGDSYVTGDVEFRTGYFKCPKCEFSISFDEMKKLEDEISSKD